MKKKLAVILTAAVLTAAQGVTAFAVTSPNTDSTINTGSVTNNGDNQDPEPPGRENAQQSSQSSPISGAAVGTDNVRINADVTTTNAASGAAQNVTVNERGQAVIGDAALEIATGEAATAGLPNDVTNSINAINGGQALNTAGTGVDTTGYAALTQSNAIVIKDAQTNQVSRITTRMPLYVPNLTASLQDVRALVYFNDTGRWEWVIPSQIDYASKTIYLDLPGSCTVVPVHRV